MTFRSQEDKGSTCLPISLTAWFGFHVFGKIEESEQHLMNKYETLTSKLMMPLSASHLPFAISKELTRIRISIMRIYFSPNILCKGYFKMWDQKY